MIESGKIRVKIILEGGPLFGIWFHEKSLDETFVTRAVAGREAAKVAMQDELFKMFRLIFKRSQEAK